MRCCLFTRKLTITITLCMSMTIQQQQISTSNKPDHTADTRQRCCSHLITALGQWISCTAQDRLTNWSSTKDDHILARLNFASSTCVNSHRQGLTHCTLFKTDTLWQLEAELCRVIYKLHFETRCLLESRHAILISMKVAFVEGRRCITISSLS